MKKALSLILGAASLYAGSAMAVSISCDLDGYTCQDPTILNQSSAYMNVRVSDFKTTVEDIIWSSHADFDCQAGRTFCSIRTYPFDNTVVTATVLYTDGTYESRTVAARWEDDRYYRTQQD